LDLATISFPGRTSISFVDGEDPPIALDLCTSVSLLILVLLVTHSHRALSNSIAPPALHQCGAYLASGGLAHFHHLLCPPETWGFVGIAAFCLRLGKVI